MTPPRAATPLLRLEQAAVAPPGMREPLLTDIMFDAAPGECIALVGPSGAGKTTLLRTLAAMLPPCSGTVRFGELDLSQLEGAPLREVRTRIAIISQKHDLVETLRVDRNVMAGALGRWSLWRALRFLIRPTRAELADAKAALAKVGLEGKLKHPTSALSGGEQQRVAIARALIQGPELLLADEPVASLDPVTAAEVLELLTGLARSSGMALICSLHQPELAARYCDRILELRGGTVVERGKPELVRRA